MTVDELVAQAFDPKKVRTPRSPEYKEGVRRLLDRKINGTELGCPYHLGSAQADAFFAGIDEGHAILRNQRTCICPPNSTRIDCPRCGQQQDQPSSEQT